MGRGTWKTKRGIPGKARPWLSLYALSRATGWTARQELPATQPANGKQRRRMSAIPKGGVMELNIQLYIPVPFLEGGGFGPRPTIL
jgi:hypothetical protein